MFLCVELCGLTFRKSDDSKANLIGTAIFGDGAAAVLLRVPDEPAQNDRQALAVVHAWGEHTWPESRDIMGWRVEDDGLGVIFSRDIPALVRQKLRTVTETFLRAHGTSLEALDGVLCHPGGEKVLAALEQALDLPPDGLRHARDVLRDKGNMSAVTVLAVLERALQAGARYPPHVRVGPGLYGRHGSHGIGVTVSVAGLIILLLVALQRIGELILDRGNIAALMAEGVVEHGARHYPLFIILHAGWLLTLFAIAGTQSIVLNWWWVAVYGVLQLGRIWVIRTLGPYWTTRIITIPHRPLVTTGPYRFVRHPNYVIVVAEIAVLPLAFGAWQVALVFSVFNAALLMHRIKVENGVLAPRR